ncbi:BadF/BadG/BcrA/BcrD ATPase family protein [Pseudophaeobacter profundi]|uniref:BadF/BadG/BcrA/BcrD ATPase family protein n=1 Tax=Pseudophaeobacter profundi TaxID=3034152 RepID=UPI002431064A|nr:BadF/BadG/BcrA/BcrD ATPase family protein [Pseudophaeobacter profundi]
MRDSKHKILIGVDGGGTGCRAAIGTADGGVLARAEGGRANAASDFALTVKNIIATVRLAAEGAGIPIAALETATAHIGIAGVLGPETAAQVAAALPFKDCKVTDDRPTAVTGALGAQDGYLLSVGTGTIAAASQSGVFSYVGGWGFQVSDQASGAWLGRAALAQVLLCHDGLSAHTDLTRKIFARFDNDPNAIVTFSLTAKPGDFATYAPDVVTSARAGDVWGRRVVDKGADYLMRCLGVLGYQPGDRLCLSGGLGPHYAAFLPAPVASGLIRAKGSALDGAFQLAKASQAILSEDAR